jgi:inorganic pyrophosphatase
MHAWHDIPLGSSIEASFPAVIETPRDSRVQYALEPVTGLLRVKRMLFSAVQYPANYGFVPGTLADDDEPLDVLVLGQHPIHPLSIVRVRAIGVLRMTQGGARDDKVLAVHLDDPVFAEVRSWKELRAHQLAEVERFFRDYRALERVEATTDGFATADEAKALIRALATRYERRGRDVHAG